MLAAALTALAGAVAVAATGSAVCIAERELHGFLDAGRQTGTSPPDPLAREAEPAPSKIREVAFLIDGRRSWVERHAPYSYGYDGNYLVTSWMKPGLHTFTVVAVATNGRRATISSRARTSAPKPPPAALAGSWHRRISVAEAGAAGRSGLWTLVVDSVGWRFFDPTRGRGALVDVAYLSAETVEARGGIATRDHHPRENNPWCDEPFQPVRYRWHVTGVRLSLALAEPSRCDGQSRVWAGTWTRR